MAKKKRDAKTKAICLVRTELYDWGEELSDSLGWRKRGLVYSAALRALKEMPAKDRIALLKQEAAEEIGDAMG